MILVDSNVFMYAAGAEHPNKRPSLDWLARVARDEIEAGIDAEVLQEILHRYRAIQRWDQGRLVYDLARDIFPVVISITAEITDRARGLLDQHTHLVARGALHAAVMEIHELDAICSYDRDFDRIEGIDRIEPDID